MEQDILAAIREEFAGSLNRYLKERDTIEKKIEQRRAQIERLKAKAKKVSCNHPRWTEDLLRPVITEISRQLPGWHLEDDPRLIPMGLGCRVSVFFYRNLDLPSPEKFEDSNSIYIVFLPGELSKGELLFETGQTIERYCAGTIGEINGFNHISKKLESIDEAVQHLKEQIKTEDQL